MWMNFYMTCINHQQFKFRIVNQLFQQTFPDPLARQR